VGQTLRTALDGTVATRYTQGNQEYDLRVMFPRERFRSPEDLGSIGLFPGATGGAPIYLRDVARVRSVLGPTMILRENQNRAYRLTGDAITEVASIGEVNDSIRARLASIALPDGYRIVLGGEEEAILAGIVVNNAILLVEYIEQGRRAGHSREESVIEAGAVRLRPILMTTLTTACGMFPLALGLGDGSELMQPLAIAVVGGLSVSTLLTLFVVPSAYLILTGVTGRLQAWLMGTPATARVVDTSRPVENVPGS